MFEASEAWLFRFIHGVSSHRNDFSFFFFFFFHSKSPEKDNCLEILHLHRVGSFAGVLAFSPEKCMDRCDVHWRYDSLKRVTHTISEY